MGDEQKYKSISYIINQHPVLKKYAKRGIIGLLFSVIFSIIIKFIGLASFDEIMEWLGKLISLILSLPGIVVISLVIIFLVFIYFYKKMNDEGKFKQKFLKDTKDMIENDSSISNITIQGGNKKESISINIQRNNKKSSNTKMNSKVVDFKHHNLEVK